MKLKKKSLFFSALKTKSIEHNWGYVFEYLNFKGSMIKYIINKKI